MTRKLVTAFIIFNFSFLIINAQTPKSYTSSELLLQLKKLNVLGSVLYIAAHPDDENTRLLAYLANEKMYRTGYLSLTRGDGGQNLIGDEQGIDLGLIRTQELLAARRIDGAEQFFSTAYDFGYSKSPEEAMRIWGHDKILSDVVWVIRKFRPDVIITRFPTTGEGGHGHHTASAILAGEAFDAAADPTKFPEQLTKGVSVWQAKRLLWNTFSFGGTNTQSEDQLKIDVGMYNPLLGKSYGEIAALSRSQHKSQGFGVPAQRGTAIEYFKTIKGEAATNDLMDGVNTTWDRLLSGGELISRPVKEDNIENYITDSIIKTFNYEHPENSVPQLVKLYSRISTVDKSYYPQQKLKELNKLIEISSGLYIEATTGTAYAVQGDSLKITFTANNRLGANIRNIDIHFHDTYFVFTDLKKNLSLTNSFTTFITEKSPLTQPYWLENAMEKGRFNVTNQSVIGDAENVPISIDFFVNIDGTNFIFTKPIRYKYTDPVKGEIYQPVSIVPPITIKIDPEILVTKNKSSTLSVHANKDFKSSIDLDKDGSSATLLYLDLLKGRTSKYIIARNTITSERDSMGKKMPLGDFSSIKFYTNRFQWLQEQKDIQYNHIPTQTYFKNPILKSITFDLKTSGSNVGYIPGAGDKVPEALAQMGYTVTTLKEADITAANLKQFDAVVSGVRAYNTNDWMNNVYDALMQYVKDGGVFLVQYNTSNFISNIKSKIGPYDFTISRNRVTDEEAKVNFLLPDHPALNYPNKITQKDFEGWIQERSIYHAEKIDSNYKRIFSMKDPGENEQDGSLIIANYGKGRFIYTGLVFFRELPVGVPGAYRLFANLISNKMKKQVFRNK